MRTEGLSAVAINTDTPSSALSVLLDSFRLAAHSEREKGAYFEELIQSYLRNEASYRELYSEVWTYAEWALQGVMLVLTWSRRRRVPLNTTRSSAISIPKITSYRRVISIASSRHPAFTIAASDDETRSVFFMETTKSICALTPSGYLDNETTSGNGLTIVEVFKHATREATEYKVSS